MKIFSLLLLTFLKIGFSQTLVFLGKQDTITFQEDDLIKLNGKKYIYQKAIKDKTQLQLLEPGLFRKATIILNTSKIETFRKYERFRISNSLNRFYWTCNRCFNWKFIWFFRCLPWWLG